MAKKGSMPTFETIADYISSQSEEAQIILNELRRLIKETVPEAEEIKNYKVPSFKLIPNSKPEQQIMIVAYANHVSFYPFQATVDHFKDELKNYKLGKGTVKFPLNKPLPIELIIKMLKFRKDEILKGLKSFD